MSEESVYTPSRRTMIELREEHTAYEFGDRTTKKTLAQDLLARHAERG
jgi:hypothetical protein